MNLLFVTEARFIRLKDGSVYGEGASNTALWERYLKYFNCVYVIARIKDVDNDAELQYFSNKCDYKNVQFLEIPYYVGPLDYFRKRKQINIAIQKICQEFKGVFLLRVPGNLGNLFSKCLKKNNIPFGIEVVGDPWEVFNPKHFKHPLVWFFRIKGYLDLKGIVKLSSANLYVTSERLQKRYPVEKKTFSIGVSDVFLDSENNGTQAKEWVQKEEYKLISVGSLEQLYKSPDIVLKALSVLKLESFKVGLVWLGEGRYLGYLKDLAKDLGVGEQVDFKGNVAKNQVYEEMEKADLFLLVSKTEGMPRALIEAMSKGLPCIGSNVGGIPELIQKEMLLQNQDHLQLARLIKMILTEGNLYNRMAGQNLEKAGQFSIDKLEKKRQIFFDYLKSKS